jgi:hypothetical protein
MDGSGKSALGQKQTFGKVRLMSALPPKADILRCDKERRLFDHLVSDRKQAGWDRQTERLGSFKVDDEFKFDGLLSRQV